jgi:Synergist-CTERM protein sorting domain-containing protein
MKGKKFLALAAVLIIAFAGIAWASPHGRFFGGVVTKTIAGTEEDGFNALSKPGTGADAILTITGYGSYIGDLRMTHSDPNPISVTAHRVLDLEAKTGDELVIAPKKDSALHDLDTPFVAVSPAVTGQNAGVVQLVINQLEKNNGTVTIKASNADYPTSNVFTRYYGGTFAFGGTLNITGDNSLGQGPVGIQARANSAKRDPATFKVEGVTKVTLGGGAMTTGSETRQPFYLVRDDYDSGGVQRAIIYSGNSGVETDIVLNHGLGEIRHLFDGTPKGGATADDDATVPGAHDSLVAPDDFGQFYGDYGFWAVTDIDYSEPAKLAPNDYYTKDDGATWYRWYDGNGIVGTFDIPSIIELDQAGTGAGISLVAGDWTTLDGQHNRSLYGQTIATRLVKDGGGRLTIESTLPQVDTATAYDPSFAGGTYLDADNTTGYRFDAITGARHTGGTEVLGGTLVVKGSNAATYQARYTGYLGAFWSGAWQPSTKVGWKKFAGNTSWGLVWNVANNATERSTPVQVATAGGLVHNPLSIKNAGSRVVVDRSQFFSYFNSDEGTYFTAKAFDWAGNQERPQIAVTLNRKHSTFAGKLGEDHEGKKSSFDLVLHSATSARGLDEGYEIDQDAQGTLTLANAENDVTGETYVSNGVLAVAGANSIATKGTGNLYVGPGQSDFAQSGDPLTDGETKAVFLGLADATFTNKTIVSGTTRNTASRTKLVPNGGNNRDRVLYIGALAAASGTTTSYQDVTIAGAIEINPQAVSEVVAYRNTADSVYWTNLYTYPTWGGTVRFGGTSADYNIGGNTNNITQIIVSRGVLQLDSLPADADDKPFANVTIRETGTLSLGENVNDFGNLFDVQVDDDSRIRVKIRATDLKTGEAAVKAGDVPAVFTVRTIDTTWLGSGPQDKDRRLAIQLDLSGLSSAIPAGTWIKVVEAEDAVGWNNIHYLRDDSDTFYEDYAKVRPAILNNTLDLTTKVVAHVDENPYVIYLEFKESVDPTDPGTTPSPNFTFEGTGTATADLISGSIKLVDNAGAPVASTDVTVELFRTGVEQISANALVTEITTTDETNGVAAYDFEPADANLTAFEAGVTYVVKASAEGYTAATKSVTIPGGAPITGSSSSGCDAGFGVFALLAATGAATLLRKKD